MLSTALRNGNLVSPNSTVFNSSNLPKERSGTLSTADRTNAGVPGGGSCTPCTNVNNARKSYTRRKENCVNISEFNHVCQQHTSNKPVNHTSLLNANFAWNFIPKWESSTLTRHAAPPFRIIIALVFGASTCLGGSQSRL